MRAIRLISKFMTSRPGEKIIELHKLSNISRSKGNQTFGNQNFGQLREYKLEKHYFFEKSINHSKLSMSLDQ